MIGRPGEPTMLLYRYARAYLRRRLPYFDLITNRHERKDLVRQTLSDREFYFFAFAKSLSEYSATIRTAKSHLGIADPEPPADPRVN